MNAANPQETGVKKHALKLGALAGVVLAIMAFMFVKYHGSNGAWTTTIATTSDAASQASGGKAVHVLSDEQLLRMVKQANAQVESNPKDAAAWAMLAHTYDMLGKFAESSKAYAKLVALMPDDAQVLADYADALAVANGRVLTGQPEALLEKALTMDPQNAKALALSGTAAMEKQNYDGAIGFWQRARAVSKDESFSRQLDASIAAAKAASTSGSAPEAAMPVPKPAKAGVTSASAVVAGHLSLADDLVATAVPDATVFIFARPVNGSLMPVALMRKHVRDLPFDFTLDDTMAMVPNVKLSQVSAVVIGARVSVRGDVTPQHGDMQGWSAPVSVGTKGIKLEISEVIK